MKNYHKRYSRIWMEEIPIMNNGGGQQLYDGELL